MKEESIQRQFKRGDIVERIQGAGEMGEKAMFLEYHKPAPFSKLRILIRYLGHRYYESEFDVDLAKNFKLSDKE